MVKNKNKNERAILRYEILVLKRRGVTRDLPSGTESLQWVTNTATLISGEHDAIVVDTFATIIDIFLCASPVMLTFLHVL